MTHQYSMRIRFYGTIGSISPTIFDKPGNTPCVEIRTPNDYSIILDFGNGIRELGKNLMKKKDFREGNGKAVILSTHHHWDHIQGFPFFDPAYTSGNEFTMYGKPALEKALKGQMKNRRVGYSPVDFGELNCSIEFKKIGGKKADIKLGEEFNLLDGFTAIAHPLSHPKSGCLGYRIESPDKKVIAYLTDHEVGINTKLDENARQLAENADLLIIDSFFTQEDYIKGWGHSKVEDAVRLGKEAGAKRIRLFHHHPDRTNEQLGEIEKKIQKELFRYTIAAREGQTIYL